MGRNNVSIEKPSFPQRQKNIKTSILLFLQFIRIFWDFPATAEILYGTVNSGNISHLSSYSINLRTNLNFQQVL